jgi:hypothetical protein
MKPPQVPPIAEHSDVRNAVRKLTVLPEQFVQVAPVGTILLITQLEFEVKYAAVAVNVQY